MDSCARPAWRALTKMSMVRQRARSASQARTRWRQARSRRPRAAAALIIHILGRAAASSLIALATQDTQGLMVTSVQHAWQGHTRTSTAHLCARCALTARTRLRRRRSRMRRALTVPGTRILPKAATTSLAAYAIKGTQGRMGRSAARVLRAHTRLSMARLHACYVQRARTRWR